MLLSKRLLRAIKKLSIDFQATINEIIQFAGSWSDLPEEYFKNFHEEVEERRRTSSSRKFSD